MDDRKKKVLQALEANHGIVTNACKALDMPRSTFYVWMDNDPEFKSEVEKLQDVAIDFVESKLFEKINGVTTECGKDEKGNPIVYKQAPSDTAIIFYLKTKAKKRGYVERQEIDNNINLTSAIVDWSNGNQTDTETNRG